jgi:hypothetical protein
MCSVLEVERKNARRRRKSAVTNDQWPEEREEKKDFTQRAQRSERRGHQSQNNPRAQAGVPVSQDAEEKNVRDRMRI